MVYKCWEGEGARTRNLPFTFSGQNDLLPRVIIALTGHLVIAIPVVAEGLAAESGVHLEAFCDCYALLTAAGTAAVESE